MAELLVALDLDHTCLHHAGVGDMITAFFMRSGVQNEAISSYLAKQSSYFSLRKMEEHFRLEVDLASIEESLREQFASNYYDDVVPFAEYVHAQGAKLAIVTRGDEAFQSLKIRPFERFTPSVEVTRQIGEKADALLRLSRGYRRVLFVDDRIDELEPIEHMIGEFGEVVVQLRHLKREDAKYRNTGKIEVINNFSELRRCL